MNYLQIVCFAICGTRTNKVAKTKGMIDYDLLQVVSAGPMVYIPVLLCFGGYVVSICSTLLFLQKQEKRLLRRRNITYFVMASTF